MHDSIDSIGRSINGNATVSSYECNDSLAPIQPMQNFWSGQRKTCRTKRSVSRMFVACGRRYGSSSRRHSEHWQHQLKRSGRPNESARRQATSGSWCEHSTHARFGNATHQYRSGGRICGTINFESISSWQCSWKLKSTANQSTINCIASFFSFARTYLWLCSKLEFTATAFAAAEGQATNDDRVRALGQLICELTLKSFVLISNYLEFFASEKFDWVQLVPFNSESDCYFHFFFLFPIFFCIACTTFRKSHNFFTHSNLFHHRRLCQLENLKTKTSRPIYKFILFEECSVEDDEFIETNWFARNDKLNRIRFHNIQLSSSPSIVDVVVLYRYR